jgi:hypothetical protein
MPLAIDTAGPFDVRTNDLMKIGPVEAVDLFRQLLVIEARSVGLPITSVNVPADVFSSDGGVDADVAGVSGVMLPAGLISEGSTCYQIKTGSFSASTPSDIRSLLVQPKFAKGTHQCTKDQLQPRVLKCFENGGTFVVVLFGTDLVGTTDNHGASQIIEFMKGIDPEFAKVRVRILRANQLCSAITVLAPGLAMRLNSLQGYDDAVFRDLTFMGEGCALEIDGYQSTDELDMITAQITRAADNVVGFQHVRVLGDAGSGKTHLIYRALIASHFNGCVLYCPDPERAADSGPLMALREMSATTTIILVGDECNLETAEQFGALFRRKATKMLLVTADNVLDPVHSNVNAELIEVPRLEQPIITDIFKGYGIPQEVADWLATLCEGSPRAAHSLGQYIQSNPGQDHADQLSHLDHRWDRMVCAPYSTDSVQGMDRLAVIRTFALFQQVGWETAEGAAVQSTILASMQELSSHRKFIVNSAP